MRVLITGGSRGIGRACVKKFAEFGHSVAFIYKSNHSAAADISAECGALAICADLSRSEEAKRAVDEARTSLGGIDVLINNAGISQIKMLCDVTDDDWQKMLDTNLSSAFYISRNALPDMVSQKWGRIINIGSMWGKVGASCEAHYSASKAGLRGFTMALAKELGPSGITVNAIEPGIIATEMNSTIDEAVLKELVEETPLCRIGHPEDVAELAYFLASESASFITGQIIGVDGGYAV